MKMNNKKLTLFDMTNYIITVQGLLDEHFSHISPEMRIEPIEANSQNPHTSISCTVDQSGLLGVLRHLYTLGLPIISVKTM